MWPNVLYHFLIPQHWEPRWIFSTGFSNLSSQTWVGLQNPDGLLGWLLALDAFRICASPIHTEMSAIHYVHCFLQFDCKLWSFILCLCSCWLSNGHLYSGGTQRACFLSLSVYRNIHKEKHIRSLQLNKISPKEHTHINCHPDQGERDQQEGFLIVKTTWAPIFICSKTILRKHFMKYGSYLGFSL